MKSMTTRKSDGDLADAVHLCTLLGVSTEAELRSDREAVLPRWQVHAQELFFERIIDAL